MKHVLSLIALVFLLSAVATAQKTPMLVLSQSPSHYDVTHLDEHNKPLPVYDSFYVVQPNWKWAWHKSTEGSKLLFIVAATGAAASVGLYATTIGSGSGLPLAAITFLAVAGEDMEWYRWNSDRLIPKAVYDSLMASGDTQLKAFWAAQ